MLLFKSQFCFCVLWQLTWCRLHQACAQDLFSSSCSHTQSRPPPWGDHVAIGSVCSAKQTRSRFPRPLPSESLFHAAHTALPAFSVCVPATMTERFSEAQEDLGSLLGLGSRAGELGEERASSLHPPGSGRHSVKRREPQSQSGLDRVSVPLPDTRLCPLSQGHLQP